jgi:putative ABC transport system permease protein
MNDIFGLSMTYVMIGLLCVLGVAFAVIGWVLVRNRIMFLVGVRNIPRRRAQTILIIVGLMLSTLIISTAFSIGDTAEYSITNQAYDRLHSVDEIFQAQTGDDESDPFEGGSSVISAATIQQDQADDFVAKFNELEDVDGAINVVRWPVSVEHEAQGQAEPIVLMIGLDGSQIAGFESDLETLAGDRVAPDQLAADEIFINESLADEIDAAAGDTITLTSLGVSRQLVVRDTLKDRVLTGALIGTAGGIVVPLERAQELSGRPGEVDMIAVSNTGGVRSGVKLTDNVVGEINDRIALGSRFIANDTKREIIDDAAATSTEIVSLFVILGLFSIAAGMMLIFLIFVMLAAERKVEMGMMRAVGTKRNHLVQSFMSEGMVYNVGSAAVGCALGIIVSIIMIGFMARLFAQFDVNITFHVTPRSLIVSYAIGVVLTFITVTFSAWRIGALNIVSAIRDTADPVPPSTRPPAHRVLAMLKWLTFKPTRLREWGMGIGLLLLAVLLAVLVFGLFTAAGAVYDDSSVIRGVPGILLGIAGGFVAASAVLAALLGLGRLFQLGALAIVLGIPLILLGFVSDLMAPYAAGASLLLLGTAMTLVMIGVKPRAVFTTAGIVLLVYWLLTAGQLIPPELEADFEMFFLSGITMVLASTFVLVYNADLLLGVLTFASGGFTRIVPSIRTAVAYPLANKFRTGMTIAMISIVMFALVTMSTINGNFRTLFSSDKALGGYDVLAEENPGNPIGDLEGALREEGGDEAVAGIAGIDRVKLANPTTAEVAQIDDDDDNDDGNPLDFSSYPIAGLSDDFIRNIDLEFQNRAVGFDSDRAVWDALLANPDYAVIDAFSLESGGFGDNAVIGGIEPTDKQIEPIRASVRDNASGKLRTVSIIGVISTEGSGIYNGLLLTDEVFDATFERPESSLYLVRVEENVDAGDVAKRIESTLVRQGVQADSLRKIVEDFQAQIEGFLYLIQGFMAIGLFVGIAAVGVIAFRTVIERRQQIGMLRAIGFSRGAIALSFIVESAFVTLLGILSGITLGLLLAFMLMKSDEFVPGGVDNFYIPWDQILVIGGLAFVASLLMTIIPSRQASGIPIAEALRYE